VNKFQVFAAAIAVTAGLGAATTQVSAGTRQASQPPALPQVAVDWRAGGGVVTLAGHFPVAHLLTGVAGDKQARLLSRTALSQPVEGLRLRTDEPDFSKDGLGTDEINTGAVVRPAPAPRPAATASGLFGSVALPFRKLPALRRFDELKASFAQSARCGEEGCRARVAAIRDFVAPAKGRRDLVDRVNRAVNGLISYKSDREAFGVVDRWAGPAATLARGYADCEDYALLKMALLAGYGVEKSAMTLVVLRDRSRNAYHAVLAVKVGDQTLVLDNLEKTARPDSELAHYMPLYSISNGKGYIHGFRAGKGQVASAGSLSSIAPGEGVPMAAAELMAERGPR
jgi:predicted transglutaminase-like cysteine proteinase